MRIIFWIVLSALLAAGAREPAQADPGNAGGNSAADARPGKQSPASLVGADSPQAESLQAFDQWANEQDYYPASMLVGMRARLSEKLASLPPFEAATFRDQFIAKLQTFHDSQWQNAAQWLVQTLAVASDSYAKTIQDMLPDVVADSPGEIRAKLRTIAIRAINLQQVRQGFEQTRQVAIQTAREDDRRQAQLNAQVRASMTYSTPNLYSPASQNRPVPYQRYNDYFNRRYGSPFSYAWGGVWFF